MVRVREGYAGVGIGPAVGAAHATVTEGRRSSYRPPVPKREDFIATLAPNDPQREMRLAAYELLAGDFDCEPRGTIAVKGKGEVETWYLVGPHSDRVSAADGEAREPARRAGP